MNLPTLLQTVSRWIKRKPILFGAAVVIVITLVATVFSTSRKPTQADSYYEVKRGDFLVSVVEGGTLQAVNEVSIRNEVEGTARIIYIVPEGSNVKKGDLLVEFDAAQAQNDVNQQQINVEKAQFSVQQAEAQLAIQKSVADSETEAARLKVEFAQSDLDKYTKGEAEQALRNAQIDITNVIESLQIAAERLQWTEKLYKQGFETKGNLDKDRLTVNQTNLKLEQATNSLWMVETFDIPKQKRELQAALKEAQDNLARVKLQNDRRIAQSQADLLTQQRTLSLNQERLERDKQQLEATKIYAPQAGLVVYGGSEGGGRFSNESMIEEGAVVRNRQVLIKLPDVSSMKLSVKIHESHVAQVHPGQPAFVVLDSMPDERFNGVVTKVAPLPDSQSRWSNPDLKVYATDIRVTDQLPGVKPGVSARAEIIITNLHDVLTVPIQAVTTLKGKQVVFLAGADPRPVPVGVGLYNTRFIEVTSGLDPGARVLLAPPMDSQQKDLGGSIVTDGDAIPAEDTNTPPTGPITQNGGNTLAGALASGENSGPAVNGRGPRSFDGMRGGRGGRFGGPGMTSTNWQERMKRFDTNGDGRLDEDEMAAMRAQFGRQRNQGGRSDSPATD